METNPPGFRSCENKGFQMFFENGWGISVQFGPSNYCERRDLDAVLDGNANPAHEFIWESPTAEAAIFTPDGSFLQVGNNTVMGWLKPGLVGQIISILCVLPENTDPQTVAHRVEGLIAMASFRESAA